MGLLDAGFDGRTGLLGALEQQDQFGGLLGSFQPKADEGLLQRLFGSNDPRDPRGAAMMGLASGLLRGSFADGVDRFQRAYGETEDRNARRTLNSMQFNKGALELSEAQRKMQEEATAREVYQDYWKKRGLSGAALAPRLAPQTAGGDLGASVGTAGTAGGTGGAPEGMQPMQPPGGVAPRANMYSQYKQLGDHFGAAGLGAKAQSYYELAEKHRPKFSQTPQLMRDPSTGNPVQVLISDDGTTQILPFGAKPDIAVEDLGGVKQAIDRNAMRGGETFAKTMTPGEIAQHSISQANLRVSQGQLGLSRERFNAEQAAPQYMQLDGGLYALPKRPQPGAPLIGQPVMDQGGQPLGPPLKPIPASANTAIMTNLQNLNRAQQALALVKGGEVGAAKGDQAATGLKGYLPNGLLNRMDASGVDTRAAIADLGSLVIHDRSGAAVTAAESPRLMPFIPLATDDRATVEKKLTRFLSVYQQETDAYAQTYARDQGYRENPALKRQAGNANEALPGALPLPADLKSSALKRGQTYMLPNGKRATWDGLQFRAGGQ